MTPLEKRLSQVEIVTIYLGNKCNFDCNYCDRGYIESIGNQAVARGTADEMWEFFKWIRFTKNNVRYVSLHGGEPLLFAKRIDEILGWLTPMADRNGWDIGITTNGSLVKENEWLYEKWTGHIKTTVSYDFMFQEENRDKLDVMEMAEVLNNTVQSGNGRPSFQSMILVHSQWIILKTLSTPVIKLVVE